MAVHTAVCCAHSDSACPGLGEGGGGASGGGGQDAALTMKSGPNRFISTWLSRQTERNLAPPPSSRQPDCLWLNDAQTNFPRGLWRIHLSAVDEPPPHSLPTNPCLLCLLLPARRWWTTMRTQEMWASWTNIPRTWGRAWWEHRPVETS